MGGALLACWPKSMDGTDWNAVRRLFPGQSDDFINASGYLLSPHPLAVQEEVERHRRALDANGFPYIEENEDPLTQAARRSAAAYLETDPDLIALTDSTTMGL